MSNLITKDVIFGEDILMATQNKSNSKIFVYVKQICSKIGLSRGQTNGEIAKIQSDLILNRGCTKFRAGVFDPNNETIALDLEFLPLWLAKISITPKMIENKPEIVSKLVDYQLKAKDVLAKAFLFGEFDLPSDYKSALSQLLLMCEKNEELTTENKVLIPKAEAFDTFLNAYGYQSFNRVAKSLNMGRNKMLCILRNRGVVFKEDNSNIPYQRFIDAGYFTVKQTTGRDGRIHTTTRVSAKGVEYIRKQLRKSSVNCNEVA